MRWSKLIQKSSVPVVLPQWSRAKELNPHKAADISIFFDTEVFYMDKF